MTGETSKPVLIHPRPRQAAPTEERRRPHDRRQRNLPVLFDMRSKHERRQGERRAVSCDGRRRQPEPPQGIDVYV